MSCRLSTTNCPAISGKYRSMALLGLRHKSVRRLASYRHHKFECIVCNSSVSNVEPHLRLQSRMARKPYCHLLRGLAGHMPWEELQMHPEGTSMVEG